MGCLFVLIRDIINCELHIKIFLRRIWNETDFVLIHVQCIFFVSPTTTLLEWYQCGLWANRVAYAFIHCNIHFLIRTSNRTTFLFHCVISCVLLLMMKSGVNSRRNDTNNNNNNTWNSTQIINDFLKHGIHSQERKNELSLALWLWAKKKFKKIFFSFELLFSSYFRQVKPNMD